VPSTLIIGQGASFVWHVRAQALFREKWLNIEKVQRMVATEDS